MPTGAYIFGAQNGAYISLEHTFGDGAYISKPAGHYAGLVYPAGFIEKPNPHGFLGFY